MDENTAKDHRSHTANGAYPHHSVSNNDIAMTMDDLEGQVRTLSGRFDAFLKRDEEKHERERKELEVLRNSHKQQAALDAERWQKSQTFVAKHGGKIVSFIAAVALAFLTWYGTQIRHEINIEQRNNDVDALIHTNAADIRQLKIESINQTLMIDEGFRRVDKILVKSQGISEEDLPEYSQEFKDLSKDARAKKEMFERFGDLPKSNVENDRKE